MELTKLGYDARLTRPQFVKPYVKGNKNDANDAEAIWKVRSGLVKECTAFANRTRGLLGEYGLVVGLGLAQLRKRLPELLEDAENDLTGKRLAAPSVQSSSSSPFFVTMTRNGCCIDELLDRSLSLSLGA